MAVDVRIYSDVFDPWAEVARTEQQLPRGKCGAGVVFVGYLRDFNENNSVQAMSLEHYPGMTERHIEKIASEAVVRWELSHVLVAHRVGHLNISDPMVLIAVWSAHRAAAFDACRTIISDLKSQAPFWKCERRESGSSWVTQNTADHGI